MSEQESKTPRRERDRCHISDVFLAETCRLPVIEITHFSIYNAVAGSSRSGMLAPMIAARQSDHDHHEKKQGHEDGGHMHPPVLLEASPPGLLIPASHRKGRCGRSRSRGSEPQRGLSKTRGVTPVLA